MSNFTPERVEYWKKRLAYFIRKYGKNSIEAKAARLNLQEALAKAKGE